jgi:hypothetical protein
VKFIPSRYNDGMLALDFVGLIGIWGEAMQNISETTKVELPHTFWQK